MKDGLPGSPPLTDRNPVTAAGAAPPLARAAAGQRSVVPEPRRCVERWAAWTTLAVVLAFLVPPLVHVGAQLASDARIGVLGLQRTFSRLQPAERSDAWLALWPLLLGVTLLVSGWPNLLLASSIGVAALAISDLGQAALNLSYGIPLDGLWRALRVPHPAALAFLATRGILAALWAGCLWRLRRGWKRTGRRDPSARSEARAICGRLGALVSLLVLAAAAGQLSWSAFTRIAFRNPQLTRLLAAVPRRDPLRDSAGSPESIRISAAIAQLNEADAATAQGKFADARKLFTRALNALNEDHEVESLRQRSTLGRARGFNNLAWLLCTCPDPSLRNADQALVFARKAVELAPNVGNYWNTVGVAAYEAGDLGHAREALEQSMSLTRGGGPHDWLFLAMIAFRQNQAAEANAWFARSESQLGEPVANGDELARFYEQAAKLLGKPVKKSGPPPSQGDAPTGRPDGEPNRPVQK